MTVALLICACSRAERLSNASAPVHAPGTTHSASTPSPAPTVPPGSMRSAVASGDTLGLRLESDVLTYCDDRGGRALDLTTGIESARERPCDKHQERNRACDGIEIVDQVREPGPDEDIVDLKIGLSQPTHGHVTDCAFSNGTLLVATWNEVVAIDVKADRREVKSKVGGPQVAINGEWLAWSDGKKVFAQRR